MARCLREHDGGFTAAEDEGVALLVEEESDGWWVLLQWGRTLSSSVVRTRVTSKSRSCCDFTLRARFLQCHAHVR